LLFYINEKGLKISTLIEKINQQLESYKIDIKVNDETDILLVVEKLLSQNSVLNENNKKLEQVLKLIANSQEQTKEKIEKIEEVTTLVCRGETEYQKVLNKEVGKANNSASVNIAINLLKGIYNGLKNKFGETYFPER